MIRPNQPTTRALGGADAGVEPNRETEDTCRYSIKPFRCEIYIMPPKKNPSIKPQEARPDGRCTKGGLGQTLEEMPWMQKQGYRYNEDGSCKPGMNYNKTKELCEDCLREGRETLATNDYPGQRHQCGDCCRK